MANNKEKVLVLHSGGLDSTVCLLQAIEQGKEVVSFGIDYNQKHKIENQYAYAQCKTLGIERKVIKLEWDKPYKIIPKNRGVEEIRNNVSVAFLEGRNIVFLALACAEAAGLDAKEIWIGVNALDFSGYPDCSPEFINSFQNMLHYGYPGGPQIVASLINMTKPEIAQEAFRLGIKKGDTWSCYSPKIDESGVHPCGECDACILHNYAWENINHNVEGCSNVFSNLSFR